MLNDTQAKDRKDAKSQRKETAKTAAGAGGMARPKTKTKTMMGSCAGGKVAKGKPHRRVAGHKPVSLEQMEFMRRAKAEGKLPAGRLVVGGGARGGAAGTGISGRRGDVRSGGARGGGGPGGGGGGEGTEDYAALVAADAAAQLAAGAATAAGGKGRGGRGFFATKGKHTKSDASLASLDLADEETVRELLGRLPVGHQNERAALSSELEKNYPRWWQLLQSEFSLLFYGFGSKKALMEDFARKMLTDGGVIIVNGFFPNLTPKQILANAAAALTARDATDNLQSLSNENLLHRIALATSALPRQQQQQQQSQQQQQQHQGRGSTRLASKAQQQQQQQGVNGQLLQLPAPGGEGVGGGVGGTGNVVTAGGGAGYTMGKQSGSAARPPPAASTNNATNTNARRLYIVLHNIDGQQLRSSEAQALLGELAAMPRVHLIASVDHVNAPLLWSKREAARFNWVWQEATTFAPYVIETAHLPQLLASKGEERHIRGAANVLRTLTPNARHIFRLLAEHQLSCPDEPGMSFHAFYTQCREQFLATSEMTLRSHLTEFVDHELTRTRRGSDGEDLVVIPFAADVLAQLLKEFD